MLEILTAITGLLGGLIIGAAVVYIYLNKSNDHAMARKQAENMERCNTLLANAETRAKEIEVIARQDAIELREEVDAEVDQERKKLDEIEARLAKREDTLDLKLETLSVKERKLDDKEHKLEAKWQESQALEIDLGQRTKKLAEQEQKQDAELMRISGMSEDHAKQVLFDRLEKQYAAEAGEMVRKSVEKAEDEAKGRSRDILLNAIQRYASAQTAEHTVSSVEIADDAMKGRVIGKEGRNIRTFEKRTGVDVIIDDTPGIVVVSCFDPVRREVARESMQRLVSDGRIQPGRIEEVVDEVEKEMEENLVELGSKAAAEAHVPNLPRAVLPMLGRLHYRTSYGQNVLKHSIEVAYIAQMMADQLGLDGTVAR
ncbi:MAG: Rnase Y domain-containing protein, partial [Planctomycetota bacterium]